MKIILHRPNQIGGQITKIETASASIIIDLGHNLPGVDETDALDNKEAVEDLVQGCDAILYTHYHGDHIGLFHHVPKDIPQYLGAVAKRVVGERYATLSSLPYEAIARPYKEALEIIKSMKVFHQGSRLTFGDITVTSFLVSHSAYDAYMFLIEAEGKKILHSGDFRQHGYLGKGLQKILAIIGRVDILITEGTMVGRPGELVPHEREIQRRATRWMKKYKYVFVQTSSTDLERLAGFKAANKMVSPRRPFLCDDYQKRILTIFNDTAGRHSPLFTFRNVYDFSLPLASNPKLLRWMKNAGFTLLVRTSKKFHTLLDELLPQLDPSQVLLIYSQWHGYIDPENAAFIPDYPKLHARFSLVRELHTSGHADIKTLRMVCEAVSPSIAILPIHRDDETDFASILSDGMKDKVRTENFTKDSITVYYNEK